MGELALRCRQNPSANFWQILDHAQLAQDRGFYPACGSPIIDEAEIMPNVMMIMAGRLDDASWVKPESEIFCDSVQLWVQLGGERCRSAKGYAILRLPAAPSCAISSRTTATPSVHALCP